MDEQQQQPKRKIEPITIPDWWKMGYDDEEDLEDARRKHGERCSKT